MTRPAAFAVKRVYRQTIGLDFYERVLKIQGQDITIQLWDVGGQSISSKMIDQFINGAGVIFICYDVTDAGRLSRRSPQRTIGARHVPYPPLAASFADAEDWLATCQRAQTARPQKVPPLIYLCGNKVDLQHLRKVKPETHERFVADHHLAGGFFISARSGENVLSSFYSAAARFLGKTVTASELETLRKVIGVTVVKGDDDARTAEADRIEREDAEAEKRKHSGGCCSLQ